MKNLMKSALIIGHAFGLLIGDDFTDPITHALKEHPSLLFNG